VKIAGESAFKTYAEGSSFKVAPDSSFDIHTGAEPVNYVCSFG
jgi:purine/pyrimidine-nucleoside phosphorylase